LPGGRWPRFGMGERNRRRGKVLLMRGSRTPEGSVGV
jgi:hypothetical protein